VKYIKKIFVTAMNVFRELKWSVRIGLMAFLIVIVMAGSVLYTGKSSFCNTCHIMNPYYDSWQESSHSEVKCIKCHIQPGFAGYVKGKINGLAQAVDCIVGRIGTKPNATVPDISCLREGCHNTEELTSKTIDYKSIKFTHRKHIAKKVDGMNISCGMCHSHFEGEEHFSVNSDVCFTCHFLKDKEGSNRLVETTCLNCHEVPDKVIQRGMVMINHAEFVSYEASCDESCHKKQIEKESDISETVCLNCHSFSKDENIDSKELHEIHTMSEKVECFACHGKVSHRGTETFSVSGMIDCKSCHSDTHSAQFSIYAAEQHPLDKGDERVLSPMFLTHVECTGCHIERGQVTSESLDSIGRVAKAVPRACDKCHEPGTGDRYIPFWQAKVKKLYEQVNIKVRYLQEQAQVETDTTIASELESRIGQAKALMDSVESDGSWGVHNLKYTEALLLKANEIVTER
jgi:hypothetical protein